MAYVNNLHNYWISQQALSITLNALGEANRIQASVASGAAIICYIEGIKPADPEDPETAQNGDGLEFDNGHNFKRWSLTISPTYFNDNERKYLYVAIPKTAAIGTQAAVVFPSKKLDIYGYEMLLKPVIDEEGHMHDAEGNVTDDPEQAVKSEQPGAQIGSPDYFYIWLQGIISVPTGGKREWEQKPDTGDLKTDRSLIGREDETWFRWDTLTQTVTFLKEIWMDEEGSFFNNLLAKMVKTKQLILNGHTLNGVAIKGETPPDSDDTIVTPAYLGELVDGKYLRKDQDDRTEFSLGVGGDLTVDGMTSANGGIRTDEVRSSNYTGDSIADTGFLLTANSNGHSKLTIDEIYVRMKAVFESLEVKKWSVNAGDEIWSCAANVINRVDYYADASQAPLGYSYVRVPWLLKGIPFILSKFSEGLGRKMYAALAKVRRNITDEQLKQVRFCRCYFLAKYGQTEIDNWWQQDDLARCQTMNVRSTARETYTTVQQKAGNVFWWRKVVRVSSSPVELEQGKSYHYFDVAYNYEAEKNDTASVYALYGSDIPAAGDHAVQFGNTVVPGRMNLMMIQVNGGSELTYDPNSDAPCIKAYKGIYCFNLNKCWFGGSPLKMKLSPSTGYLFYGPEFKVVKEYGVVPVPTQRGAWADIDLETDHYTRSSVIPYSDDIVTTSSRKRWDGGSTDRVRKCYYYDEVSHKGCTWLCSIADDAHWVADETFTAGAKTFTKDKRITDADYAALSPEDKVKCSRKPNYTADEPSDLSPDWRKLVDRGTSVMSVTTKYGKSDQGTDHTRVEQWVTLDHIADLALKNGDYMWTWTHTEYSDTLEPTDIYYASRWGIDGDGIASINSYYWGTSDTALVMNAAKDRELGLYMPGDSHWAGAGPESKWFDQFGTMATANGGVGAMQGWNVWQKTVIHYDLPEGRSQSEQKPDIVNYTMSRLGIDGMMVQEEYYCLRDSDQFATAFGGYTYDKCGIRYYKLTGGVPDENGRLSTTTPNVNTDIWTNQMPVYDNSTPDKAKKKFLWNFEQRADGQGTEFASRPICIGDHSRGIKGVLELYALSASGTPQSSHHIPDDIWAANNNSETDYSKSDPTKPKTWTDELADRAPTEALPYQWNWTRTLYTTPLNAADTQKDPTTGWWYEDHWHVSAVRGTKGEDGAGTEYVYCRPQSHNADGTPLTVTLPDPNILKDKDGVVRTAAYIKQTDDFIPYEYTDNPVGIDFQHQIEYQCERKSTATTGAGGFTGGHEWGAFSSPKPWSKWGKNGMDGDGTEYVFIRTTKNVAPVLSSATATDSGGRSATDAEYLPLISNISACGAETNGKAGECTDDPKGCTRDWPYEWVAKRTMAAPNAESGQRVWKTYYASVGSPYKMSPWSNYAENSMRLDLSNEMDMVQTDSTGKILAARTVETLVHFYDGAKEITLGNNDLTVTGGPDVTSANKIATFSNTASGNARKLSWAFIAGKTMAAAYNITVSFTYLDVTHTVTFTVAASMGQPIYQMKPSINVIAFSRKVANNALDPVSRKLTLSVVKIDGSSTSELPVPGGLPAGFSVRYSTVSMPASATAGTVWGTADGTSGITWSGAEMTVANSVTIGEIFIAMFNSAGTLIDRETIPVMKDGEHGDGIKSITRTYQISASGEPGTNGKYPDDITSWVATSPAVTEAKPYLWVKEVVEYKYKTATTEYYCIGARGDNGVDAQDIEWVYIRTKTSDAPTILNDSTYTDTNGHNYTFDDHLPQVSGNANIENNGSKYQCTDDPKGVDATWKFEWEAKREKGAADANGHRAWVPYSGTMTLHNNLAESSFVIDIDNDNDQFGVDADGKVLIAQTRSTVVSMLYGTQEQAFNSAPSAALKYDDGTSVASSVAEVGVAVVSGSNNKEYRITVTIKTTGSNTPVFGASGKNGLYVDITGTCAKGTKTIRFTLEKVMGGAPGVNPTIYQIALSQKVLSYGRDASNNLVAKSNSVTVNVKKTVGNDSTIYTSAFTDAPTISWGYDDSATAQETGKAVGYTITLSPANVGTHKKVWIKLTTGDKEEVPIVTDGTNGTSPDVPIACYRWYKADLTPEVPTATDTDEPAPASGDATGSDKVYPTNKWSKNAPNRPADGWHLWMCQSTKHTAYDGTITRDSWTGPVRISGDTGSPGEDSKEREWVYKRQDASPGTPPSSGSGQVSPSGTAGEVTPYDPTLDDWVPAGWSDSPLGVTDSNKTEWASWRDFDKSTKKWGAFNPAIIWSHYGERGMDGDGVEYVFMRTTNNTPPVLDSTQSGYSADEFLPKISNQSAAGADSNTCTDDPTGVDATHKYEWVAMRTKLLNNDGKTRSWDKFYGSKNGSSYNFSMKPWNNFAEDGNDGKSAVHLDLDNEHEDFLYDDDWNNKSGSVTSQATLYDGENTVAAADVTWAIDSSKTYGVTLGSGGNASISSSGLLTVTGLTKASLVNNSAKVTVKATYPKTNGETYYAAFTSKVMTQDKYDLILSPSSLPFNSAVHTSTRYISISTKRLDITGATTYPSISSQSASGVLRLFYALVGDDGTVGTLYQATGSNASSFTVTKNTASLNSGIFFELRKYADASGGNNSSYTVVDYETVPIAKAENGTQGPQGKYSETQYAANNSSTEHPAESSTEWSASQPSQSVSKPFVWQRTRVVDPKTNTTDSWSYVRLTGTSGSNGKAGRWYDYAGVWGVDIDPAVGVTNTASIGYYVFYNDHFYMSICDDGVANTTYPPDASKWEQMADDRDFYIGKAFFGDYAQFGAGIINQDWSLSRNGTIGGVSYGTDDAFEIIQWYVNSSRSVLRYRTDAFHLKRNTTYHFVIELLSGTVGTIRLWVDGNIVATAAQVATGSSFYIIDYTTSSGLNEASDCYLNNTLQNSVLSFSVACPIGTGFIPAYQNFDTLFPNGVGTATLLSENKSTSININTGWTAVTDNFKLFAGRKYRFTVKMQTSYSYYRGYVKLFCGDSTFDDYAIGDMAGTTETTIEKDIMVVETGNYVVKAGVGTYGSVTVSSIILECLTDNMFIPVNAQDMRTGKSYQNDTVVRGTVYAIDGEFKGTIRSSNFYHSVCYFMEGGVYRDENEEQWAYCADNTAAAISIYNFEIGRYYSLTQLKEMTDGDVSAWPTGFKTCSYIADIINMVPKTTNWTKQSGDTDDVITVRLPRPQDFVGKTVEVFPFAYGTEQKTVYIGCVIGDAMTTGVIYWDGTKLVKSSGSSGNESTVAVNTDTRTLFQAIKIGSSYYWKKILSV